jgi:hypothetical protein
MVLIAELIKLRLAESAGSSVARPATLTLALSTRYRERGQGEE